MLAFDSVMIQLLILKIFRCHFCTLLQCPSSWLLSRVLNCKSMWECAEWLNECSTSYTYILIIYATVVLSTKERLGFELNWSEVEEISIFYFEVVPSQVDLRSLCVRFHLTYVQLRTTVRATKGAFFIFYPPIMWNRIVYDTPGTVYCKWNRCSCNYF